MNDTNTNSNSTVQIDDIIKNLEEGVKSLFESEKYMNYLKIMSKFHNYSFNNSLLIAMQMPQASLVAGYSTWKNTFHRQVEKGQKAIKIIAPSPYKIDKIQDKIDPNTNRPMLDAKGNVIKEKVKVVVPAYKVTNVFDVSQTSGEPLPSLVNELSGNVDEYNNFIEAIKRTSPVPIKFEEMDTNAKGYYNIENKCIVIKDNMSQVQTAKTLIHEIAHSILHEKETGIEKEADRNTKEVQAESVAYATCQHFNIDTSDYSFGYIAGWSSGKEVEELRNSMNVIRQTASDLINGIEKNMSMLMEKEKDYSIIYFVTSNAEYPEQGEMYETENIDEAIEYYNRMINNHSKVISGIGFTYKSNDEDDIYNDSQMMLVIGNKLCIDVLEIDKFKDIEEIKSSINIIQNKIPHIMIPTEQKTHNRGKSR